MQKSTSITIGGRRFYLEEDGYSLLDDYLESLRAYFAAHRNFDDIIADIESRIAERFAELQPSPNEPAIATQHVAGLIDTIGRPSDIGEGNDANDPLVGSYPRRLFRDIDNGLIAGVCAGLGSYFKKDPNIIRVLFVLAALLWGIGIWVYLVFWLVIPAARTSTERLSMRGAPVTLASLAGLFSLRGREAIERDDGMSAMPLSAAGRGSIALAGATRSVVAVLLPVLKRIVAFAFIIGAAALLGTVCVGLALALTRFPSSYFDATVMEFMEQVPWYTLVLTSALALLIPAIFILAAGVSMLRRRSVFQPAIGFGLLAVWFVALITSGVLGIRTAMRWQWFEANHPAYQRVSFSVAPPRLTSFDATGASVRVRLVEGLSPHVTFEGRKKDVDRLVHTLDNGALRITEKPDSQRCVVCDDEPVLITVAAPASDSIIFLSGVQRLTSDPLAAHTLRWALDFPHPVSRVYSSAVEAVRDFGFAIVDSTAVNARFRTIARAVVPSPGDPVAPLTFPDSVAIEVQIRSAGQNSARLALNVVSPVRPGRPETAEVRRQRGELATLLAQRMEDYVRRPR